MRVIIKNIKANLIDISTYEKNCDLVADGHDVEYIVIGDFGKMSGEIRIDMDFMSIHGAEKLIEGKVANELKSYN